MLYVCFYFCLDILCSYSLGPIHPQLGAQGPSDSSFSCFPFLSFLFSPHCKRPLGAASVLSVFRVTLIGSNQVITFHSWVGMISHRSCNVHMQIHTLPTAERRLPVRLVVLPFLWVFMVSAIGRKSSMSIISGMKAF